MLYCISQFNGAGQICFCAQKGGGEVAAAKGLTQEIEPNVCAEICLRCLTPEDAPHNYCALTQSLSLFVSSQQSPTLWLAARPVSPRRGAPCSAGARGAPAPARSLHLGVRGTPSPPSRNGSPIPSARRTPTPLEKRVKLRGRPAGRRGVASRHRCRSFPTVRCSRGLWSHPTTMPSSLQERR